MANISTNSAYHTQRYHDWSLCKSLYKEEAETELIQRIRDYAENHVSMDAAMANVIEVLKRDKRADL